MLFEVFGCASINQIFELAQLRACRAVEKFPLPLILSLRVNKLGERLVYADDDFERLIVLEIVLVPDNAEL